MKPVFQEIVRAGEGDCFSACLASLLELPLEAVPKFRRENPAPNDMMHSARVWLAENFGLSIVTIQMEKEVRTGEDLRLVGATPGTPVLAGGHSANMPGALHCVVGEVDEHGMNFRMTHDPNPGGKGIAGRPLHLYFLVPLGFDNCIASREPIPMVLHCPGCGTRHIDAPEPESGWTNPPHKSHKCRPQDGGCGLVWRPADVPTNGVAEIKTRGDADTWQPVTTFRGRPYRQ